MIHIRSLLKRVLLPRPDLTEAKGEAFGMWAIKETVRTVCRETGLMIEVQQAFPLYANTHVTPISSVGNEILKLLKVEVANLPGETGASPSDYLGTFDATTGTITPTHNAITKIQTGNAGSFPTNGFYICKNPGTLLVDSITDPCLEGDVFISNGAQWLQYKSDDFTTVEIVSKQAMDKWVNGNQANRAIPRHCAQMFDSIYWYCPTSEDTVYRLTLSVVPNLINWDASPTPTTIDMITIPLPVEAESTIVAGASEIIMSVPGTLSDPNKGMLFKAEFQRGMSGLKAVALLGNHRSWLQPPNLLGREMGNGFWRYRGIV